MLLGDVHRGRSQGALVPVGHHQIANRQTDLRKGRAGVGIAIHAVAPANRRRIFDRTTTAVALSAKVSSSKTSTVA